MVEKKELKDSEMYYPLKMGKLLRGLLSIPCPDCKTPQPKPKFGSNGSEIESLDYNCLSNCLYNIDTEVLSDRQFELYRMACLQKYFEKHQRAFARSFLT